MTPEEARRLLGLAAGAVFVIHLDSDEAGPLLVEAGGAPLTVPELTLAAHAPDMAAMIAGMRTEYAIAYLGRDGTLALIDEGYETLDAAQHRRAQLLAMVRQYTRIMRRPVGEWEEADATD